MQLPSFDSMIFSPLTQPRRAGSTGLFISIPGRWNRPYYYFFIHIPLFVIQISPLMALVCVRLEASMMRQPE